MRDGVKKYDIHKPKSYELKVLGKLVVQHGVKTWLERES